MVLEDLPDVPPAVPLLVGEVINTNWEKEDPRVKIRKLIPELKKQSRWYFDAQRAGAEGASNGKLEIYLDGGLNLFDPEGACRWLECRVHAALNLTRSIGLMADKIWLTDRLSHRYAHFGRPTEDDVVEVLDDALVLATLWPLIAEGIIRFKPSVFPLCPACGERLEGEVDAIADHLIQLFESEFRLDYSPRGDAALYTGDLFYPPMHLTQGRFAVEADPAAATNTAWDVVREAARKAIWVSHQAASSGGAVMSNSKAAMAALAYREGHASSRSQLRKFEARRNINIPWVSELNPGQIVQLRQEAAKALPTFRESFATALESSTSDSDAVRDTIAKLREQSAEVRSELENTKRHAGRFWKTSYMTLGFGISAYGVGTGEVLPALGGLLPLLQLMVSHKMGTEKDVDKLQRRPGYVLMRAQDILAHSH